MEKVIDQMITGQSILRDRYDRRGFYLMATVLALSVVASLLAFATPNAQLEWRGWSISIQLLLGSFTGLIFFLTLLDLLTNWRQRAGAYAEGTRRLSEVKSLFRGVNVGADPVEVPAGLKEQYERVTAGVPPIPESQFLRLKARHQRKVALSRAIDEFNGAPLLFVMLVVMLRGMRKRNAPGADS